MPVWSPQQDAALLAVSNWLKDKSGPQVFRLFGWAGTGKSTLAVHLAQDVRSVKYAAFTGKAALVMRKRGCKGAQTIHSLIYTLVSEKDGEPRFVLDDESPAADADLIVIDEVSMVDEQLGKDLLSFGVKVLVLGDPFQLPPVQGAGFFTADEPDIMLTEIHRQAADNPIIHLSMQVREGGFLERGTYGDSIVVGRENVDRNAVLEADQVLVGRNKTRLQYNDRLRELKGLPFHEPVEGDRMVCLRNNPRKKLLNGQIWIVTETTKRSNGKWSLLLGADEGKGEARVLTHKAFFSGEEDAMSWPERRQFDEFTFGYCLTVHKAQGSQWDNVYLFDESFVFREERARWLYTGITRAAEKDHGRFVTLLQVRHETVYRYARPVQFGEHRMLVRPRDSMEQTLESFGLAIRPKPASLRWIHDVFGNGIAIAEFTEPAEELRIVASMVLDHTPELTPAFEIERRAKSFPFDYGDVDAIDLAPTLRRQFPDETEVDDWARRFLDPRGPTDTGNLLASMTLGIRESFKYLRRPDPGTQKPSTTLSSRQGTCRDFALLMIEAARSLGLAARFVTGYLYSPARDGDHRGGGATHAWCQVYLPGAGWVEFDPTNGIIGTRDLIRVGVAREPRQAIPIAGTFIGKKEDYLGMSVDVVVERVVSPQDGMG